MVGITKVKAKKILDSRGRPTIEVVLKAGPYSVKAQVPSGKSTGAHEAVELREKNGEVKQAIKNVDVINKAIYNLNPLCQKEIDQLMINLDGTENKSKLGANAILGVSIAVCRAGAMIKKIPLYQHIADLSGFKLDKKKFYFPMPCMNIINGGQHANNSLDIQEYMVVPYKVKSFSQAFDVCKHVFENLGKLINLKYEKDSKKLADEGGYCLQESDSETPIKLILDASDEASLRDHVKISLDVAASEIYRGGKYHLDGKDLSPLNLIKFYKKISQKYPMLSIEDPFYEESFAEFTKLRKEIGKKTLIVGDDLLTTNIKRIEKAIKMKSCNALLLKMNQIGTITETIEAANLAHKAKWKVMVSHRSGETTDDFIADLAVGLKAEFIKSGAPSKKERLAKYNRLLEIEKEFKK